MTLSGANDYTGITTIQHREPRGVRQCDGFWIDRRCDRQRAGTNYTQVNSGATAQATVSTAEAFLLNGTGLSTAGALRISGGSNLSSLVQLGSNSLITGNFGATTLSGNLDLQTFVATFGNGGNANTLTISGLVTGTGTGSTGGINVATGSGNPNGVNLTNTSNTYSGTTTVNGGGTLGLGGDTVLGSSTLSHGRHHSEHGRDGAHHRQHHLGGERRHNLRGD